MKDVQIQDLLDLRKNAWVDKRPKKLERAMTLKQVEATVVVDTGTFFKAIYRDLFPPGLGKHPQKGSGLVREIPLIWGKSRWNIVKHINHTYKLGGESYKKSDLLLKVDRLGWCL